LLKNYFELELTFVVVVVVATMIRAEEFVTNEV